MNGGSGQDSVTFFVLRGLRNCPALNETGFVALTITKAPGVFSWFTGSSMGYVNGLLNHQP